MDLVKMDYNRSIEATTTLGYILILVIYETVFKIVSKYGSVCITEYLKLRTDGGFDQLNSFSDKKVIVFVGNGGDLLEKLSLFPQVEEILKRCDDVVECLDLRDEVDYEFNKQFCFEVLKEFLSNKDLIVISKTFLEKYVKYLHDLKDRVNKRKIAMEKVLAQSDINEALCQLTQQVEDLVQQKKDAEKTLENCRNSNNPLVNARSRLVEGNIKRLTIKIQEITNQVESLLAKLYR